MYNVIKLCCVLNFPDHFLTKISRLQKTCIPSSCRLGFLWFPAAPPNSQGLFQALLWCFKGQRFGFQKHQHLSAPPSAQKMSFQLLGLLALARAQALWCGREPRAGAEALSSPPTGVAAGEVVWTLPSQASGSLWRRGWKIAGSSPEPHVKELV